MKIKSRIRSRSRKSWRKGVLLVATYMRWGVLIPAVAPVFNGAVAARASDYAVVVSRATNADDEWAKVVQALVEKHDASVIVYAKGVDEALGKLQSAHPRYTCFLARPDEATRLFVSQVHKLTRKYDDDPYCDTLWGILTGYDAANALAIAKQTSPLVVRKVAAGTDVALEMCEEGVWYCELVKGKMVRKERGGAATESKVPDDTTQALVDALNVCKADLFVTSGHATERDWQIGFRYRNGSFISKSGQMFGRDTNGRTIEVDSPNSKVYLPIGNCLMGHIDGPNAMALAWMNDVGVRQMIGYTVPTWYGYAGWGCLDYFVEQPGRYTFAEAFHVNQHALMHRLLTCFPEVAETDVAPGRAGKRCRRTNRQGKGSRPEFERRPRPSVRSRRCCFLWRPEMVGEDGRARKGLGPEAGREGRSLHIYDHAEARRTNVRADQHKRLATRLAADCGVF